MHLQGRRWGSIPGIRDSYTALPTFRSYGVENDFTIASRENLRAAVPIAHQEFLQSLPWMYEVCLPYPPGKLIAVHAGIRDDHPAAGQLAALRARSGDAQELQQSEFGRFDALSGRGAVEPMHPELDGRAILVSGHHGFRKCTGDRFIVDSCAGEAGRPLEALVFPERLLVSSSDRALGQGLSSQIMGADEDASARMQEAMEAGIIPGARYVLKLRREASSCLCVASNGALNACGQLDKHGEWVFDPAGDGYFFLRSVHPTTDGSPHQRLSDSIAEEGDQTCSDGWYLGRDLVSGEVRLVVGALAGARWSIEMHGKFHFVALVEKETSNHLGIESSDCLRRRRSNNIWATKVTKAFKRSDVCEDGFIDEERLRRILRDIGISEQIMSDSVARACVHINGMIQYEDFMRDLFDAIPSAEDSAVQPKLVQYVQHENHEDRMWSLILVPYYPVSEDCDVWRSPLFRSCGVSSSSLALA